MKEFVEVKIISAVKGLLTGRVNEILDDVPFSIPSIEFTNYDGASSTVPEVRLVSCESGEKERIVRQDVYLLTVSFSVPQSPESGLFCFAYAHALCRAVRENPALGGAADRVVVAGKKYVYPKTPYKGEAEGLAVTLRVTVEGAGL